MKLEFINTNPNVLKRKEEIHKIEKVWKKHLKKDLNAVYELIVEHEITCPISGSKNWTEVRQFNLMFQTELGSVSGESSSIF